MADMTPEIPATEALTQEQIDALIRKHRAEIDRIVQMGTADQQKEFMKYGLNPQALEKHYRELVWKSAELEQRGTAANSKALITGMLAFFSTGGGLLALGRKLHRNRILRGVFVAFTAIGAGFIGSYLGSLYFGEKVRNESKILSKVARSVFEKELAIAIENSSNNAPTQQEQPAAQETPEKEFTASVSRKASPAPREGFMAEVAKENAAPQMAQAQR
jgi:hypothetical protein